MLGMVTGSMLGMVAGMAAGADFGSAGLESGRAGGRAAGVVGASAGAGKNAGVGTSAGKNVETHMAAAATDFWASPMANPPHYFIFPIDDYRMRRRRPKRRALLSKGGSAVQGDFNSFWGLRAVRFRCRGGISGCGDICGDLRGEERCTWQLLRRTCSGPPTTKKPSFLSELGQKKTRSHQIAKHRNDIIRVNHEFTAL